MRDERNRANNKPTRKEKFVEVESPDDFNYEGKQTNKDTNKTRNKK